MTGIQKLQNMFWQGNHVCCSHSTYSTLVSHTRSWLCYYLLLSRKWTSQPDRGRKWVRDRDGLSIFCSIASQLRVWDTDSNECCGCSKYLYFISSTLICAVYFLLYAWGIILDVYYRKSMLNITHTYYLK